MNDATAIADGIEHLALGQVEHSGSGWQFAVIGPDRSLVTMLVFDREDRALRARAGMADALNAAAPLSDTVRQASEPSALQPPMLPPPPPEHGSFRQWTHTLLEEGQLQSLSARLIEGFLILLIVANVVAVALETIPSIYTPFAALFTKFEEFSLAAYTIEYVARVWSSVEDPRIAARGAFRGRIFFALRPMMIVDFLALAPSFLGLFFGIDLRVLRIFRLFRLLKLARYSQALQALLGVLLAERSALFASVLLLLVTTCFYGELMHIVEGSIQPHVLGTMPGAMYWAITTLATVGYGDIVPITPLGKLVAGMTMVTGLALFALPIGIIANGFVTGLSRRKFAITWTMLRRQPLFQGFDADSLNTILEVPTAAIIREHAHITVEGKDANEFYLIVSGQARMESETATQDMGPGEMIGEEALYHSGAYSRTVTAETDLRVIAFPGDELRRLCRKFPVLRQRIETALAHDGRDRNGVNPAMRLRDLEAENARLRHALSELALDTLARKKETTQGRS